MPVKTIAVSGLNELVRDLGRVERGLRRELQEELKKIGTVVSDEAKRIAETKGLRDSGALIAKISPGVRGGAALVRETATRHGFKYPAVYEFGGRGTGEHGPRAFLLPALEAKQDEAVRLLEDMLERLTSEAGLGMGGTL